MSNGSDPPPLVPALRGGEEREFIERCVRKQLMAYAGVFGLLNLIALGAMFYSVPQAATTAAKSEAQDYVQRQLGNDVQRAEKLIDTFVELAKRITDKASDRIDQFDKEYQHLLDTKERLEVNLAALQDSFNKVKTLGNKTI